MCPVCLLTTAGISILSGVITTSALSAVAIRKTVSEPSMKQRTLRAERPGIGQAGAGKRFLTRRLIELDQTPARGA